MATTFTNKASAAGTIGTVNITGMSNEVVSTMATNFELVKTQASTIVKTGSTQRYTITIKNLNSLAATDVEFSDNIPVGMSFVTGTFKVNAGVVTPIVTGNLLKYTIPTLAPNVVTTVEFTVMVS